MHLWFEFGDSVFLRPAAEALKVGPIALSTKTNQPSVRQRGAAD
jgi:hypothetical protein